jgi:hypothetical protein
LPNDLRKPDAVRSPDLHCKKKRCRSEPLRF